MAALPVQWMKRASLSLGEHTLPLYAYRCTQCGHRFEKIQNFSAEPELECPVCHGVLERPLTAPRLHFKGAGWYVNDYAAKSSEPASDGGSGDGKAAASDSKTSEAKSGETKSSDGKSSESSSSTPAATATASSTPPASSSS
jgi:putative FmdB family regulatory protein